MSVDNIGAHRFASFYESFNVENFCRFCLISRDQIETTEVKDIQLRDVDEHDAFLEELRQNDNLQSINGVQECVLNKHLASYQNRSLHGRF